MICKNIVLSLYFRDDTFAYIFIIPPVVSVCNVCKFLMHKLSSLHWQVWLGLFMSDKLLQNAYEIKMWKKKKKNDYERLVDNNNTKEIYLKY